MGEHQPDGERDYSNGGSTPGEVAGKGNDADVDRGQLYAGHDRAAVSEPRRLAVDGDRRALTSTVDDWAGRRAGRHRPNVDERGGRAAGRPPSILPLPR